MDEQTDSHTPLSLDSIPVVESIPTPPVTPMDPVTPAVSPSALIQVDPVTPAEVSDPHAGEYWNQEHQCWMPKEGA